MAIVFFCTECDQKLRIDDDFAGRLVACPQCGARLRVPESSRSETPGAEPSRPQPSPQEASRTEAPASGPPAGKTGRRTEALTPLVRHAKRLDFEELIDMTAMVDIVFLLLI